MIVGIDLGTTHSLIAAWRDGQACLIPNAAGEFLTPSCVSLLDDGSVVVGTAARDRLQTHPRVSAALFKRYMGSNREITLGSRSFRPEELSSLVLRTLKADAEAWLGEPVREAVITVPAYFSDAQRKATRVAGEMAGLQVERLLNEPTAAALAYGIHAKQESSFLVVDLGGGTFDVSVLELFEGVMEVRASAGDNFLGGEDFTTLIAEAFLVNTGARLRLGLAPGAPLDGEAGQRLRAAAERAKCMLSEHASANIALDVGGQHLQWVLTQETFAALAAPLLERLRAPVERALRDARIRPEALDRIVLAGGATRMPMVRRLVARMFGRFPEVSLHPDEVVAMGAAVQAGLKARDAHLDEVVMTDVTPYSLGIEVARQTGAGRNAGGYFLPIIERNCVIPVSKSTRVNTIVDGQDRVSVRIYQGESPMVSDNVFLGQLHIDVPPRPAGEVQLDVRFTYDVNGLLEAEATVLDSGAVHALVIEENPGLLTAEEIRARIEALASLKIHPRENTENVAALARAERLFQQLLGEQRDYVGHALAAFHVALASQDAHEIRHGRQALQRRLDQLEGPALF